MEFLILLKNYKIQVKTNFFNDALSRLNKLTHLGTGAIEIKSGYGLTIDSELKILKSN